MSEIINGFLCSLTCTLSVYGLGLMVFKNNAKKNILRNIIIAFVVTVLYTLIYLKVDGTLKTVLLGVIFTITYKLLFDISIDKCLFASILYIILLIVPDLFTVMLFTKIFGVSKQYYDVNIAGTIIGNIIVSAGFLIMIFCIRKLLRKLFNYNLSTSKKIIFVSFSTLIAIAIFFYNLINKFKLDGGIAVYLFVIISLMVLLFYLFKQKIDNDAILKKYDDLLTIMKTYESDIEEQRINIHETRNELMTIKSKIQDKEKEKNIIKYIDSIIGDKVSSSVSKYSKFTYLPSNGLKGFFYYKFLEADKKGITVSINISKQIEKSILSRLDTKNFKDFTRIIGVYLDNAIDASLESKDKKLGIEIYLIKNKVEIMISNTYANKVDKDKIGNKVYTTKGKNRGHGLLLVSYILKGNKMFKTENKINEDVYTQKIIIDNN